MSTELVYRMRTCAAALASTYGPSVKLTSDAADLLAEASNIIDTPEEPGEPMEILAGTKRQPFATWGTDLPSITPQPCPSCGSIDARSVKRNGRQLMLTCPRCSNTWEYGK
jgi:hypothetical protein